MSNSLWPQGLYSPWNSPGQNTGVDSLSVLQGNFPTQGSNPGLPHCRQILYQLNHKGSPRILEWIAYPFSSRSSWPRNRNGVSYIAGGFFTNWTIREDQSIGLKKYSNFTPRYITKKTENIWPHKNLHTNVHNSSFFPPIIFISWRLITLQHCSGFCHTLTWISDGLPCVPHPGPHPTPLGHPSAPVLSTLSHASNLDWRSVSHLIIYMFWCCSFRSSHPHLLL